MIRQQLSVVLPVSTGTQTELTRGKAYGFRITPSAGQPAAGLLVTLVRRDGANETPFTYRPSQDGWIWFTTPIWGLKATAASSSTTATVDVLWATEAGDRADPATGSPELLAGPAGADAGLAERVARKGVNLYDNTVGGGTIIDTQVLDTTSVESLTVSVDNSAGVARNANVYWYAADGGTVMATTAIAVPGTAISIYGFGAGHLATGLTSAVNLDVSPKFRFQLLAGGAASCRVTIWGR